MNTGVRCAVIRVSHRVSHRVLIEFVLPPAIHLLPFGRLVQPVKRGQGVGYLLHGGLTLVGLVQIEGVPAALLGNEQGADSLVI